MNNIFKTLIAGYGAKKLGGGCFSTILIFIVIYWALGTCDNRAAPVRNNGLRNSADSSIRLSNNPAHLPQASFSARK